MLAFKCFIRCPKFGCTGLGGFEFCRHPWKRPKIYKQCSSVWDDCRMFVCPECRVAPDGDCARGMCCVDGRGKERKKKVKEKKVCQALALYFSCFLVLGVENENIYLLTSYTSHIVCQSLAGLTVSSHSDCTCRAGIITNMAMIMSPITGVQLASGLLAFSHSCELWGVCSNM